MVAQLTDEDRQRLRESEEGEEGGSGSQEQSQASQARGISFSLKWHDGFVAGIILGLLGAYLMRPWYGHVDSSDKDKDLFMPLKFIKAPFELGYNTGTLLSRGACNFLDFLGVDSTVLVKIPSPTKEIEVEVEAKVAAATPDETMMEESPWSQTKTKNNPSCLLEGNISDCTCGYSQVEALNEEIVRPKLTELVQKKFFSYFKVDLHCKCPIWPEDGLCSLPACSVCECADDQVPQHLLKNNILECKLPKATDEAFSEKWESQVDRTVHKSVVADKGMKWQASDNPWLFNEPADASTSKSSEKNYVYVDLHLNPERFTGYKGEHANRIWKAIYSQSCFHGLGEDAHSESTSSSSREKALGEILPSDQALAQLDGAQLSVCKEKEVFYRLISGIHTSITAHIAADHPKEICGGTVQSQSFVKKPAFGSTSSNPFDALDNGSEGSVECILDEKHWGPNLNLFYNRLGKKEFKSRVENLYFVYLFTLQAAVKASPYLMHADFSTGHPDDDSVTKTLIKSFLSNHRLKKMCTKAFDEGMLWNNESDGGSSEDESQSQSQSQSQGGIQLQQEMQLHFQNISQIMNCVGCEKCKLWGKLQILGLGTALKILFNVKDLKHLVLTRNEVIGFFNLLGRLSESLHIVNTMLCTLLGQGYKDVIGVNNCNY